MKGFLCLLFDRAELGLCWLFTDAKRFCMGPCFVRSGGKKKLKEVKFPPWEGLAYFYLHVSRPFDSHPSCSFKEIIETRQEAGKDKVPAVKGPKTVLGHDSFGQKEWTMVRVQMISWNDSFGQSNPKT